MKVLNKVKDIYLQLKHMNIGIQKRLLISYIFLVLIPVSAVTIAIYSTAVTIIKNKVINESLRVLELTVGNIDKIIFDMKNVSSYIVFDSETVEILKQKNSENIIKQSDNCLKMDSKFRNIQYTSEAGLFYLSVIDNYDFLYRNWDGSDSDFYKFRSKAIVDANNGNMYINYRGLDSDYTILNQSKQNVLSIWRNVIDLKTSQKVGEVFVSAKAENILGNLKIFNDNNVKGAYLIDLQGNVILSKNRDEINKKIKFYEEIKSSIKELNVKYSLIDNKKGNYILEAFKLNEAPYFMVEAINYNDIFKDLSKLMKLVIIFFLLFLIFLVVFSIAFSKGITYPIKKLSKSMEKVQKGDFTGKIVIHAADEMNNLVVCYNSMLDKINELINQIKEEQNRKRLAEINMLQAQIKPHFLFNTLNSFKWMALISQSKGLSEAIGALSEILRSTIVNTDSLVTIRAEIRNIESYITIEKIRYGNLFEFKYNIDEELMNIKVPKFLLQPIIENSIVHGFSGITYRGLIEMSIVKVGKIIVIRITDNGKGIEIKRIRRLTDNNKDNGKMTGIGVMNVNERIKLIYGDKFGLCITALDTGGTAVEIKIPSDEIDEVISHV